MNTTFKAIPVTLKDQGVLPSSTIIPTFDMAVVDTRALSVEIRSLVTLDDHLKHRIRAIAGDNQAILSVYHGAADYGFTSKVSKELWPRYIDREVKTNVASTTLSVLDEIVSRHLSVKDKQVQLVVSALLASMLEKQGMLSAELPEVSVRIPREMFPSFAMMKNEALVKATYDRIRAIDVEKVFHTNTTGALALKPFAEVFAKYSHIFRDIELIGDKIDAYGAGLILKLYDMDSSMGPLRGVLNNPSLERGVTNYTLVDSALKHFLNEEGLYPTVQSLTTALSAIGVTQIVNSFQEASLLMMEPECFKEIALKSVPSLMNIYRFINNNGLPIGYVLQPNFKGKSEGLDISEYFESDNALNNLEPDNSSESHLEPLITDMYGSLRNIAKSITPLVSRVMMNSKGISEDESYAPIALHISASDKLIDHLAVSYSRNVSFAYSDGEVQRSYIFERKQKDDMFILGVLSPEVAYTSSPESVILFSGEHGVEEATGVWELGDQTMPGKIRPTRYVGESLFDSEDQETIDLLVDKEQKLTRSWKLKVTVPSGKGGAHSHDVTTSLYELYSSAERAKWLRGDRYPIAHNMPLLTSQVSDVVKLYLELSKLPKLPGYVQSPAQVAAMQFANLMVPIIKNSTFQRLLQSLKFKLLAQASSTSLEQRLALQNYMQTSDIEAKLAGELLNTLLLRLGLIDFDMSKELNTEILTSSDFYTVVRPHLLGA